MTVAPNADSASALLDRLHAAGVQLTANGDKLHVSAPPGVLTPELRAELLANKPALLEVLTAPQFIVEDGCEAHNVSAEAVASRSAEVQRRNLAPGCCACCSGPASLQALVCRFCTPLTPEREAELTQAPPCVRCGAKGYTFDVGIGWHCEACWRAERN